MLYILIVCIIIIIYYKYKGHIKKYLNNLNNKKINVVSKYDGRPYRVDTRYKNTRQNASDKLSYLNKMIITLIKHLKYKYKYKNEGDEQQTEWVDRLLTRYDPNSIEENIPTSTQDTSWNKNKGELIAICLREKRSKNNSLHSHTVLEFVALHELSHTCSITINHKKEFWQAFKFILTEAFLAGLHTPIDYEIYPEYYCGMLLTYNPYFDTTL